MAQIKRHNFNSQGGWVHILFFITAVAILFTQFYIVFLLAQTQKKVGEPNWTLRAFILFSLSANVIFIVDEQLQLKENTLQPIFLTFSYAAVMILAIKQWELGLVVKDLQRLTETNPSLKQVVRVVALLILIPVPILNSQYGWSVTAYSLDHFWNLGLSFVLLGLICHGCSNLNKCDAFRSFNLKVISLILIPFSFIIIGNVIAVVFSIHTQSIRTFYGFYPYEIMRFVWILVDSCNLVIVYQML